jgi:hypothetical protein
MAKNIKKESLKSFLAHKVKDYAEYCEYMKPRNSDHNINNLTFTEAHLYHNKAV